MYLALNNSIFKVFCVYLCLSSAAVESSSGLDSDSSLADQEFVHNQTKLLATPFSLEAGPGDWMEAWKSNE